MPKIRQGVDKHKNIYVMIRYDIDFTIDGEWHHTSGESTFPSDDNYDAHNYTYEDILHNAIIIIGGYMGMEHLRGHVNPDNIEVQITKI